MLGKPVEKDVFVYTKLDRENCIASTISKITPLNGVYVYDYDTCNSAYFSNLYLKVIYRKDYYYVRAKEILNHNEILKKLSAMSQAEKNKLMISGYESSAIEDSVLSVQEGLKIINEGNLLFEKLKNLPFGLLDYSVYDQSTVTEGTGIKFTIFNSSKKTIKYLWFAVTGYNPVGDKVSSKILKGVGPLYSLDYGTYKFDYTWFTDIVESAKIEYIKVQFMDGTAKTITDPKVFK